MEQLSQLYFYNSSCNQQCKHCWVKPTTEKLDVISMDTFKKAIEESKRLGLSNIKFTGGEPFLIPYIDEAIVYCKSLGLSVVIESNGTMIDKKRAKLIKENVNFISISMDSMKKDVYEDFRQLKGSYEHVMKSMQNLKEEGVNFQIICSLSKYNIDEFESFVEKYKNYGAGSLKFNIIMDIGNAENLKNDDMLLEVRTILAKYDKLKNINEKNNIIYDLPDAFLRISDMKSKGTCGIKNILSMFSDGRISICGIANTIKELEVGKYPQISIKEAWENGSIFNEIRNKVPNSIEGVCKGCMFKQQDLGGCRANAIYRYGAVTAPNPFCQAAFENGLFPMKRLINEEDSDALHYPSK